MPTLFASMLMVAATAASPIPRAIQINDNVRPAGQADGRVLNLQLVADVGSWHPAGANNAPLEVAAFGEESAELKQRKPIGKDGAALPVAQREPRPARQQVSVGETYDFEITPSQPQNLWLEVRRGSGEWVLQVPVQVR